MDNITIICNYLFDKLKRPINIYSSPIKDGFTVEWSIYDSSDTKVIGAFTHRIPFNDLLSMTDPIGYSQNIIDKYFEDRKSKLNEIEPVLPDMNNYLVSRLIDGATKSELLNDSEPPPQQNDGPIVWDLVLEDMRERDKKGYQKYHTHLQPFNGRDALVDAYQEALDLVVYLRQLIYEREMENDGS